MYLLKVVDILYQPKTSKNNKLISSYNQRKLKYALFIDGILGFVVKPFKKTKCPPIAAPKTILVVQSHLIGDLIMATPMLRALKKAYPESKVCLLANEFAKDLLDGFPHVDELVTMKFPWATYDYSFKNLRNVLGVIKKLRKDKFDLAIDAQIDMRNAFLMYLIHAKRRLGYDITGGKAFLTDVPEFPVDNVNLLDARLCVLEYLGIDIRNKATELPLSQENLRWVDSYLKQNNLNAGRVIGVHPGASTKEKLWQPEKFAEVIDFLNSKGYQPVIIEGPNDADIVSSIIYLCKASPLKLKTSLKNVVAFICRCSLIICLDSAAIHLAGAVGTPAVALYGPKWPELTRPFRDNIEIVWDGSFDCRPCEYGHCKYIGHSCMDAISPESVIQKINELLSG